MQKSKDNIVPRARSQTGRALGWKIYPNLKFFMQKPRKFLESYHAYCWGCREVHKTHNFGCPVGAPPTIPPKNVTLSFFSVLNHRTPGGQIFFRFLGTPETGLLERILGVPAKQANGEQAKRATQAKQASNQSKASKQSKQAIKAKQSKQAKQAERSEQCKQSKQAIKAKQATKAKQASKARK